MPENTLLPELHPRPTHLSTKGLLATFSVSRATCLLSFILSTSSPSPLSLSLSFLFIHFYQSERGTKTQGIGMGEDVEEWGRSSEKSLSWNVEWSVSLEGAQKRPAFSGDCWVGRQLLPQGPEVGGEWR